MISRLLQLGKESAVYGLSTVLGRLVAVFLVPVYTRVFTPEDYGVIAMVTTILTLVGVFVGLGAEAGFTVSYYDDEDEVRRGALVLNYVFLQLITAVGVGGVLFLVSDTVAQAFLGSAERDIYIRIAALTVVAGCLNQVAFNLFRNARKPWVLVALNTSVSLLQLGLSVLFVVVLGYGLLGNFVAQLIAAVIFLALSTWLMRTWFVVGRLSRAMLGQMLRLGAPYMLTGLSLQVILLADRFFLEYFRSLNEVGIYAIGVALAAGLGLVTSAFQMAFGPYSMSIQHQPDARVTYAHILTVFYALAAGGAVVLSLFAREALLIVSTPAYEGARFVVPYLAFYVVGVSLSYIASLGSWLAKRTDNLAWTTFVGAVVNLALHLALIPPFGIVGAGIATLAAQGVYVALLFWASQRCYPIPYRWREVFWISALSALVIAGGQFADQLSLVNGLTLKLLLACFFPLGLVLTGVIEPALIGRVVGRLVARQSES